MTGLHLLTWWRPIHHTNGTSDASHCSSSGTHRAFEIACGASRTWKLLITLGLGLCAIDTGYRCPTSRLWNHTIDRKRLLTALTTMNNIVTMEQIPMTRLSMSETDEGGVPTFLRTTYGT